MSQSFAFTDGFGTAGRLYERLRKRSLRAKARQTVGQVLGRRSFGRTDTYLQMDHQAYVKGLRDGIAGCLDLLDSGDLY